MLRKKSSSKVAKVTSELSHEAKRLLRLAHNPTHTSSSDLNEFHELLLPVSEAPDKELRDLYDLLQSSSTLSSISSSTHTRKKSSSKVAKVTPELSVDAKIAISQIARQGIELLEEAKVPNDIIIKVLQFIREYESLDFAHSQKDRDREFKMMRVLAEYECPLLNYWKYPHSLYPNELTTSKLTSLARALFVAELKEAEVRLQRSEVQAPVSSSSSSSSASLSSVARVSESGLFKRSEEDAVLQALSNLPPLPTSLSLSPEVEAIGDSFNAIIKSPAM